MTKLDVEVLATKIFSEVNNYVNRYMADMRKYVDGELDTAKERAKELYDALGQHFEARLDAALKERPGADTESLKSLERRASRHADHLARLEDRVKALEHGGR